MNQSIIGRGWVFPPQISEQGGIALTHEQSEIEQAIHIILETTPGERIMRPTFGSRLYELVFMPINYETVALARRFVIDALGMWEPRITVLEVVIDIEGDPQEDTRLDKYNGCLHIEIRYEIKATHDQRSLVYPFYVIPQE